MTSKRIPVRFTKRFANYDIGTVATFDPVRAEAMVKGGVAVFVERKPERKKKQPECQVPSPANAF